MLFSRLLIADIDLNTGRMALLKGFIVFETVFEEVKETLSPFANFTETLQSSKFRQRRHFTIVLSQLLGSIRGYESQ